MNKSKEGEDIGVNRIGLALFIHPSSFVVHRCAVIYDA
jgi:hypothetical protein